MEWIVDDSHHVKITERVGEGKIGTRVVVTKAPPSSVRVGEKFRMEGYLEDVGGNKLAGKYLWVHTEAAGTSPGDLYSYTNSAGEWWFEASINIPATWYLYFYFKGDATYEASRTKTYTTVVA